MAAEEREPAGGRDAGCRLSRRRGRGHSRFDLAQAFAPAARSPGRGADGHDRDQLGVVTEQIEHRHFVRVEIRAAGL